eukprot:TRINITY_DN2931_c1_g4_i1.p1 TRINITY_DN2931_c1_g4~~TRINITY_DN2931_c1_g4_i1.p1  ORF type:complete len:148 (-),score=4.08 TRINITY_DN2931_c1_g4_i1:467-910(-)
MRMSTHSSPGFLPSLFSGSPITAATSPMKALRDAFGSPFAISHSFGAAHAPRMALNESFCPFLCPCCCCGVFLFVLCSFAIVGNKVWSTFTTFPTAFRACSAHVCCFAPSRPVCTTWRWAGSFTVPLLIVRHDNTAPRKKKKKNQRL